jgi:hypothetical protein
MILDKRQQKLTAKTSFHEKALPYFRTFLPYKNLALTLLGSNEMLLDPERSVP